MRMLVSGLRRGLTAQEAAQVLQFHPDAVRYWLRVGELRGTRLESADDWLVEPEDLLAFLQQNGEPLPWSAPVANGGDPQAAFSPAN
jgi:hypothetical protein